MTDEPKIERTNFIKNIINDDLASGKHSAIVTRFPPEPNGYLHVGHAKSICLNFGLAKEYKGALCHLRFDDTNPEKEDVEYQEAIKKDVEWLGFDWGDHLYHASDYFDKLYEFAIQLIKDGKAYVCSLNAEEMSEYRGTLTAPGKESPHRNRSVDENIALFEGMKKGEFDEGSHVLRAKIDMSSGNVNMRDPILYRIRKVNHHRSGDKWCVYPMYDFTHPLSDMLEGITHSLCTLEFQDHRPLYDWVLDELKTPCHPQQIEFARLELNYTITSKRKLKELVDGGHVNGWDDPRMPTIAGMRRRGYSPASIRNFCDNLGVAKSETTIDMSLLEDEVRNDLNQVAPRAFCVLKPLKLVITNYPDGKTEELDVANHPQDESFGRRKMPFSKEIYIDQDDFMEDAPKKYFRLAPGKEVRLRYSYVIKCEEFIKNDAGEVIELRCTCDVDTLGKKPEGRKVKGIIHWVSAEQAVPVEVRLYDRLFSVENPTANKDEDFKQHLNPNSLIKLEGCLAEPSLLEAKENASFQFERVGYFSVDTDSAPNKPVFNRVVSLRDTWK
jgi:glutaminyl-tRNA synthetase